LLGTTTGALLSLTGTVHTLQPTAERLKIKNTGYHERSQHGTAGACVQEVTPT